MLRTRSAAACGAVLRHWNSAAAIDTKNMNARWTRMMTTSLEYLSALGRKRKIGAHRHSAAMNTWMNTERDPRTV
jgi:hypothetical protein